MAIRNRREKTKALEKIREAEELQQQVAIFDKQQKEREKRILYKKIASNNLEYIRGTVEYENGRCLDLPVSLQIVSNKICTSDILKYIASKPQLYKRSGVYEFYPKVEQILNEIASHPNLTEEITDIIASFSEDFRLNNSCSVTNATIHYLLKNKKLSIEKREEIAKKYYDNLIEENI